MNTHHKYFLTKIKDLSKLESPRTDSANYSGSSHPSWELSVPQIRQFVKAWVKENKYISQEALTELLNSLYQGNSKEEKKLPGYLLSDFPDYRKNIDLKKLDNWLGELVGWEEVDNSCQGVFDSKDILSRWDDWHPFLIKLSTDPNIAKRRSSLVLLTTPVTKVHDSRLLQLSFELINILKQENEILITKAISWLLRSMVDLYREEVTAYLQKETETLPKIAVRETIKKIKTGRK